MKALVWNDINSIDLIEKEYPRIIDGRDAIVKVEMSTICTSDLHIIKGLVPKSKQGIVLGHEFVGEIVEVGSSIKKLKKGDRVSANCETFCGECFYCKRGYVNNCEKGGWQLGCSIDGCQAEYVRVPFADMGLTKLPDDVSYKNALFVGDILASGWWGAELCEITNEDTVAVIGCGPVGLCTMICAKYFGAKQIVALDTNNERLKIAKENNLADIFINPNTDDYISLVKKYTSNRGADCVIEAAGGENSFKIAWEIARANAIVSIVAMYEKAQIMPLPDMYGKNLTFKTGGVDANCSEKLIKLIAEGKLNTDFLISEEISLLDIKQAYERFKNKSGELLKIAVYPID